MVWMFVMACTTEPVEIEVDRAAICSRLYGSTTDTLAQMYGASTEPEPRFTAKAPWVASCVAMNLTPAQLRCADPKIEMFDPGCTAELDPIRDRVQKLQDDLIASRSTP